MPRRPRMYLPGFPYHVVQRGNNREACFHASGDYRFYLDLWQELSRRYGVEVHAYCLMSNHVHFLITPESPQSISDTMRVVGSRYAQHINRRYDRTGTLWEGRHRASMVQTEQYFLVCQRYIELNPVRAGMVKRPDRYPWSSHTANATGNPGWLSPHPEYLRLGNNRKARCRAYLELFDTVISHKDIERIRRAAHYGQPLSDDHFRRDVEARYGISLGQAARGRPRRPSKPDE